MAEENTKQKVGGMAYEVILAPANAEATVPPQLSGSPPKERPISGEFIQQKLKDAEERRLAAEVAKLALIAKDKERAAEAAKRVEELNDSFSKTAEKRLSAKFDAAEENKNQHFKELQDRLKEHAKRVEEVQKAGEAYKDQLKDRIDRKMETYSENRSAQLNSITDRLKEHEKHIQTVLDSCTKMTIQEQEEKKSKIMEKMEVTLKNRESQLSGLKERLQEHEKRSEQVRQKKLNQSASEEKADEEAEAAAATS